MITGLGRLLLVGSAVVSACGCGELDTNRHPDAVFRRHEADLRDYVRRIQAGDVAFVEGRGYGIPQFLSDAGARAVQKEEDGCIVIFFDFMPTDAVPELWYSEKGFTPLPKGLEQRKQRAVFKWTELAPDWGYCRWDS
jgi:hypothetical protein